MPRGPISHIEKGGRVYLNDNIRSQKRLTRKEIQRLVEEAKKNKPTRSEEIKPYKLSSKRQEYISEITNKVLDFIKEAIETGKTPVILLPDTSMRISGMLFHSALVSAFPEEYKKRSIPFVFYINVLWPLSAEIPNILKKHKELSVLIVDESHSGRTKLAIEKQLPRAKQIYLLYVGEENFNSSIEANIKINERVFKGRGGIAKLRYTDDHSPPTRIKLKYKDYIKKDTPHIDFEDGNQFYWHEKDLRKIFFRLGIQLGQKYRTKLLTKR